MDVDRAERPGVLLDQLRPAAGPTTVVEGQSFRAPLGAKRVENRRTRGLEVVVTDALSDHKASRVAIGAIAVTCILLASRLKNAFLTPFSSMGLDHWVNNGSQAMVILGHLIIVVALGTKRTARVGLLLSVSVPMTVLIGLSGNGLIALLGRGLGGIGGKDEADRLLSFLLAEFAACVAAVLALKLGEREASPGRTRRLASAVLVVWIGVYWACWNSGHPIHAWWTVYLLIPALWLGARWLGRRRRSRTTVLGLSSVRGGPPH
jgi:hypothetical protein